MRTTRMLVLCSLLVALVAACGSGSGSAKTASAPTTTLGTPATSPPVPSSTIDPNLVPNAIPFNVGAKVGLPNGWIVQVTKVQRPYSPAGVATAAPGQQYVAVDVTMENDDAALPAVKTAKLFTMVDSSGKLHDAVAVPGQADSLGGAYAVGKPHSGRIVFLVPATGALQMAFDGPAVGTQRSIFQIDPPTVKPQD